MPEPSAPSLAAKTIVKALLPMATCRRPPGPLTTAGVESSLQRRVVDTYIILVKNQQIRQMHSSW